MKRKKFYILVTLILLLGILLPASTFAQNIPVPSINFGVERARTPQQVSLSIQILLLLTILSLAPAILIMTTSFIRLTIVFMFTRTALATQQMPPNQVLVGLSLFLTFFIMAPTIKTIYEEAWKPYTTQTARNPMTFEQMYEKAIKPLREFMFRQLDKRGDDLSGMRNIRFFQSLARLGPPRTKDDIPTYVLIPAFMLHELKRSFEMGIKIFIPFIIIDLVVASILMSMGMIMLPPVMVSLPFKIMLFVLVDGWSMLVQELVKSFT